VSARLRLVGAAVLFSTGGTAIKLCGYGVWQMAAGRALIAALAILLLLPDAWRRWSWRASLVGIPYAGAALCYLFANKLTTAASAIFIMASDPLFVLALAPLLLRERVTRHDLEYMAALGVGMALLLSAPGRVFATAPNPGLGNFFAAGCAVFWAFAILGFRWVARHPRGGQGAVAAAAASGNVIVCLAALPLALPLQTGEPRDWLVLVYLGVFQLGLAYVFLARAIPDVRAIEASLVLLVEPVLSPIWAWLVHGETPGMRAVVGGAVILAATVWHAWREPPTVTIPAPALEG
jgi:DME family drug/metabolite transporter